MHSTLYHKKSSLQNIFKFCRKRDKIFQSNHLTFFRRKSPISGLSLPSADQPANLFAISFLFRNRSSRDSVFGIGFVAEFRSSPSRSSISKGSRCFESARSALRLLSLSSSCWTKNKHDHEFMTNLPLH